MPYVGTVVNGILNSGHIKSGDPIYLGPDSNGNWHTTAVKSIQRKRLVVRSFLFSHHDLNRIFARASVTTADAGQCVSLALKRVRRSAVRKGMVIVAKTETPPKGA